jgi:hypothetical protein
MLRILIAILFVTALTTVLTHSAHADPSPLGIPLLPSIVPPLPRAVLDGITKHPIPIAAMDPEPAPQDQGFLSRVGRWLDGMRPSASGGPREAASRNPSLHDPARDRDATSFGIRTAPMSMKGAAIAGLGVAAGAAQIIDLGKVAKKLPVRLGPTLCQGGGGISLGARW